jgi:hypothetical protein
MKTPDEIIANHYVGKTLIKREFKNEPINKKIIYAHISINKCYEDAGILFKFEDSSEIFIYSNEGTELI